VATGRRLAWGVCRGTGQVEAAGTRRKREAK